jgi:ATP-dependent Clp protease adapter protein ClpS
MSAAKTKKAEETRTANRPRNEPPWNVVLHNSWHPISWVIYALVRSIPGTTIKRATRIMWPPHRGPGGGEELP